MTRWNLFLTGFFIDNFCKINFKTFEKEKNILIYDQLAAF